RPAGLLARKSDAPSSARTDPRARIWRPCCGQYHVSAAHGAAANCVPFGPRAVLANVQPDVSAERRITTRASGRPRSSTVDRTIALGWGTPAVTADRSHDANRSIGWSGTAGSNDGSGPSN